MNCSHVREHLSDYIDKSLEPKTKALMDEHLSACRDCRQEVASLRMLVDDLGSMETVAPPKDFLDQLHRRMKRPSRFSRILYILSIPMRVKLPMKLAGAVVMALLVFAIFQIQEDQYGTKISPVVQELIQAEPSPPKMTKIPLETGVQEETYNTGVAREKEKRQPQAMRVAAKRDEAIPLQDNGAKEVAMRDIKADYPLGEGGPVKLPSTEMALPAQEPIRLEPSPPKMAKLPLKTSVQEEAYNAGIAPEGLKPEFKKGVQSVLKKDEAISPQENAVKRVAHMETKADSHSRKGGLIELSLVIEKEQPTDTVGGVSDSEYTETRQAEVRRKLILGEAVPITQLERNKSLNTLLSRLREVIKRAGGEVVSVEYEEGTDIPESVHAEIPAYKFGMFQNDLQTLGELHSAPIGLTGEDKEILPIRIRLIIP